MFWEELNVNDFAASVEKCKKVCIFPIGCLEKHGNHLPLGTDIYIARDVAARAAKLEEVMLADPGNWKKHYHGNDRELALARKYSYSDRARYYIGQEKVQHSIQKLFENLRSTGIPMNMLHQYMPLSYNKVRTGKLALDPRELAMDGVAQFMLDYESAV